MTLQRPPAPPEHWLLGSIPNYQRDSLGYEKHLAKTYGDMVHIRFFNRHSYMVSHPNDVHKVLVSDADKFNKAPIYKQLLNRFLGNGLLTSDGDFWRRQRKLAQPAFHTKRIQAYADVMVEYTERLLSEWQPGADRDINHDMMKLTLTIVAKTLFNADIASETDTVWQALTMLLEQTDQAMKSPIQAVPEWIPTARNTKTAGAVKMLDDVVLGIINERRKSSADTGDLLSMLMQAQDEDGTQMTDRQLRDEAVTIVLAGHETTANALSWTWYLLSQHPDVEAKLHAELAAVLGGRTPTMEDLRQLPYTEMVIKETMRLYPPIPQIGRQAIVDVELGGYQVPAGTIIMISPHVVHHDARWYPDPEAFQPERWTREFEKALPKSAYMPFGGGPRICIGNNFAMMEATLILATMAQRYQPRLLTPAPVEAEAMLTLRAKQNMHMRVDAVSPITVPAATQAEPA